MRHHFSRVVFFLAFMLALSVCSVSYADFSVEMKESDWTWDASGISSFEGTVSFDTLPCEKLVMKLSVTVVPAADEQGEVFFQSVDGKKLKLHKQKPEVSFSPDQLKSFDFSGIWRMPESVYFSKVTILLQVFDESGSSLLAEHALDVSRSAEELAETDDGKIRLTADFSGWTLWIAVAAAAVWIAALARIIINRKHRKE